jgi:hypothetical protein
MRRSPTWPLLLVAAFLSAACGGGSNTHAGMNQYEASREATAALSHDVNTPGNPLYKHHVQFIKAVRGENGPGEKAWIAVFADRTNKSERVCVWITLEESAAFRSSYGYFVDACPHVVLRAEPGSDAYGE